MGTAPGLSHFLPSGTALAVCHLPTGFSHLPPTGAIPGVLLLPMGKLPGLLAFGKTLGLSLLATGKALGRWHLPVGKTLDPLFVHGDKGPLLLSL